MSSPKISITPNPAGLAGWFGRMLASIGVLMVIAAGIAVSPAARSAGHGWSASDRTSPVVQPTATNGRSDAIDAGSRVHRAASPLRSTPRTDRVSPEPAPLHDAGRAERPSPARRLLSAVLERANAELDRLRGTIITASAD